LTQVTEHIANFSARRLKYSTDSLLAMQGILKHYSDMNAQFASLFGLPVLSGPVGNGNLADMQRASFAAALTAWHHPSKPARVPRLSHLPSWTWAGWQGEVTWDLGAWGIRSIIREGWAADLHLRRRLGGPLSVANTSRDGLQDADFDGVLLVPQPYVMDCRELAVEREGYRWVVRRGGSYNFSTLTLCLSTLPALVNSEDSPRRTLIKEDMLLVLIALVGVQNWRHRLGRFLAVVPTTSPNPDSELAYYERVGIATMDVFMPGNYGMTNENAIRSFRIPVRRMDRDMAIC
jgi:hypothetical protein